ncbi:hypothetical protein MTO96_025607 [Rhipicephalus appendiculatus]
MKRSCGSSKLRRAALNFACGSTATGESGPAGHLMAVAVLLAVRYHQWRTGYSAQPITCCGERRGSEAVGDGVAVELVEGKTCLLWVEEDALPRLLFAFKKCRK